MKPPPRTPRNPRRTYWPTPARHEVANEGRYLLVEVAVGSVQGVASWSGLPERYQGPLRAGSRRGYHYRLTREGVALWPTHTPQPALPDPLWHPAPYRKGRT